MYKLFLSPECRLTSIQTKSVQMIIIFHFSSLFYRLFQSMARFIGPNGACRFRVHFDLIFVKQQYNTIMSHAPSIHALNLTSHTYHVITPI